MSVRVRFAPSPTGYVHIGSLRTALYDYLYAKKHGGTYVIRVEDTDRTRLVDDAMENMVKVMAWAGISNTEGPVLQGDHLVEVGDFGPYTQSDRKEMYHKYIKTLIDNDHAYPCFCSKERLDEVREQQKSEGKTPMYDKHCRSLAKEEVAKRIEAGEPHVIRMAVPENRDVTFKDAIKGEITVNTAEVDDQVLIKQDGFPTYHFAVVIDDHFMEISHVLRGDEWLISTPKQVLLYEMFNWEAPEFVHLPTILNSDRKKLSKRQGDVAVEDFRAKGYLPEALVNYLALVGWSPEGDNEFFTLDELAEAFSFERCSKSGGVFDVDKLNWMNNHYIKECDLDKITALAMPYLDEAGYFNDGVDRSFAPEIVDVLRERLDYLAQLKDYADFFVGESVTFEDDEATQMVSQEHVPAMLEVFKGHVNAIEEMSPAAIKAALKATQKETGHKGKMLFMPVRVAVTGKVHGPDIARVMAVIGKERVNKRLESTIGQIK